MQITYDDIFYVTISTKRASIQENCVYYRSLSKQIFGLNLKQDIRQDVPDFGTLDLNDEMIYLMSRNAIKKLLNLYSVPWK